MFLSIQDIFAGGLHDGFIKPKLLEEFVIGYFPNITLGGSALYNPIGTSSSNNHEMALVEKTALIGYFRLHSLIM